MGIITKPFDVAEHLETNSDILEFLEEALSTGSASDFIHALNTAARARGMNDIAKQAGVNRATLYNSLSADGNPRFEMIKKVIGTFGGELAIVNH